LKCIAASSISDSNIYYDSPKQQRFEFQSSFLRVFYHRNLKRLYIHISSNFLEHYFHISSTTLWKKNYIEKSDFCSWSEIVLRTRDMNINRFIDNHKWTIFRCILWRIDVGTIICTALSLYITIALIRNDNAGFQTDSFNFTLYKNSRFEQCVLSTSKRVNCTFVMNDLSGRNIKNGQRLLNYKFFSDNLKAPRDDWCSLVSCLRGFKVISSSSFSAAFGLTGLWTWISFNLVLLLGIKFADNLFVKEHDAEDCKINIDWLAVMSSLIVFDFWWYDFFVLASDTRNTSLT
jgi:hypothetical protein